MITWSPGMSLEDIEEKVIERAYEYYHKNEEKTASSLKIDLEKLQEKIKKFEEKRKSMVETLEMEKQKYEDYLRRARGFSQSAVIPKDAMRKIYESPKTEVKKGKMIE